LVNTPSATSNPPTIASVTTLSRLLTVAIVL
jgi:hypothetical protein